MRSLLLAFCLVAALAAPAVAQKAQPRAVNDPPPAFETTPQSAAAGADLFQAIMFDSGLFESAFEPMIAQVLPDVRASITSSPLYREATPRHRAALLAFVDTMPVILRTELTTELMTVRGRIGPRFATIMSEEELTGLAAFMRDPQTRPVLQRYMDAFVGEEQSGRAREPDFTDEELAPMEDFIDTPGGIALLRVGDRLSDIMEEEFDAATLRMQPRIESIIQGGICDALENECPRVLREQLGRT
ncbi:hypothetical protein [Terricaulis sp.]|uniref:hypothetical protein n=1 Tax=Terricaulis sp. TaxID=2768686 RepID=UPI0037836755